MHPGTVVVDLAAERGGNCELSKAGEEVVHGGVSIVGPRQIASTIAYHASQLFSKNIVTFVGEIVTDGAFSIDPEDEIVRATLVL